MWLGPINKTWSTTLAVRVCVGLLGWLKNCYALHVIWDMGSFFCFFWVHRRYGERAICPGNEWYWFLEAILVVFLIHGTRYAYWWGNYILCAHKHILWGQSTGWLSLVCAKEESQHIYLYIGGAAKKINKYRIVDIYTQSISDLWIAHRNANRLEPHTHTHRYWVCSSRVPPSPSSEIYIFWRVYQNVRVCVCMMCGCVL